MKEELMKNLIVILDYVKQGTDFVKEQAPLFIQEFITYSILCSYFWLIFSIIIFTISVFTFKYSYERFKKEYYNEELYIVLMVATVLLALAMFIVFCCNIIELLQIYFAPRYFLMKYLLNLGV